MTFQEFCDSINDGQTIRAEQAVVLSFTNSKKEVFSASPIDIKNFLIQLVESYSKVESAWSEIPTKKAEFVNYEEKSYRAIYKCFKNTECGSISSLGGSQTKPLTQLLTKLIAHLSGQIYSSVDENTLFDTESLKKALENFESLKSIAVPPPNEKVVSVKERFTKWIIDSGRKEKTARSYATTSINKADELLINNNFKLKQIYCGNIFSVRDSLKFLNGLPEWNSANSTGNDMYRTGVTLFLEFLGTESRLSALHKPFLLLAGVSGTGKTRFVREQAVASGSLDDTYVLVPVRPDWHEPSDMLGYVSRIGGQPQFIVTDILKFMVKAWRVISDAGLQLDGKQTAGPISALDNIPPYWLCLDEMNLAPVEQYFADYLSILETRSWRHEDELFTYECDPIVKPGILREFSDVQAATPLRKHLEIQEPTHDALWQHFCEYGIALPFNLIVAGTVNMDETTHGFSRKVIDRALSLDFGEYYPNDFNEFFEPTTENVIFTYPRLSDGRNKLQLVNTTDTDGKLSIDFLGAVNESLMGTPFQLAYRALNELLLAVIATQPRDDITLQAVWDDFIMAKVLPRIEGDDDKLMVLNMKSISQGEGVLKALQATLAEQLSDIWEGEDAKTTDTRPDLHRRLLITSELDDRTKLIPCRSKGKLAWMQRRLESATFTSFWP